jgi:hypothetical protein
VAAAPLLAALLPTPLLAQARLEVGWISREPRIPPPSRPDAPVEEGWPEPGRTVQWVAHVLNRGTQTVPAVPFGWRIDGAAVSGGKVDLAPGETTLWLPWRWTFARREIAFAIAPPAAAADATAEDDQVTILSDALSVGLVVEQSTYDWVAEGGRPGFERVFQREIASWNALLARAVFPTTPSGVWDRLRLDRILVVPDGRGFRAEDVDTDAWWAFPSENGDTRFLKRGTLPRDQTIVLHELLHMRGLIDLYAYTVVDGDSGRTDSRVDIYDNGVRVPGTAVMPALTQVLYGTLLYRLPVNGLMGNLYYASASLTEHCANGLKLRAGRRTPIWLDQWGNLINGFSNAVQRDSYALRLPQRTDIRLEDGGGAPIAGAAVEVYLDHSAQTYQKLYGPNPDRTLTADSRGVVTLPGDLLAGLPSAINAPPKSLVLILGVKTPRARGYAFVPMYDLNLLYFRTGPERGEMALRVELHSY